MRVNLPNKLREVRLRYQPKLSETPQDVPQELRLTWRDVMGGSVRITSQDAIERVVGVLRKYIISELGQQKSIVIE